MTFSTGSVSAKVTNPNPLECLVVGSLITMASATGPNLLKYSFRLSTNGNNQLLSDAFLITGVTFSSLP